MLVVAVLLGAVACSDADDADDAGEPAAALVPALRDELVCVRDDSERSVQDLTGAGGEMADEDADSPIVPQYVGSSPRAALGVLEDRHELFVTRPHLLDEATRLNEGVRQAEALYLENGNATVFVTLERLPDDDQWHATSMVVCGADQAVT